MQRSQRRVQANLRATELSPRQRECIEAALSGQDVFCLMPTGRQEEDQLPAVCCEGVAVVFPLCPHSRSGGLNECGQHPSSLSSQQPGGGEQAGHKRAVHLWPAQRPGSTADHDAGLQGRHALKSRSDQMLYGRRRNSPRATVEAMF